MTVLLGSPWIPRNRREEKPNPSFVGLSLRLHLGKAIPDVHDQDFNYGRAEFASHFAKITDHVLVDTRPQPLTYDSGSGALITVASSPIIGLSLWRVPIEEDAELRHFCGFAPLPPRMRQAATEPRLYFWTCCESRAMKFAHVLQTCCQRHSTSYLQQAIFSSWLKAFG